MVIMIIIVEHLRCARHCALITFLTQRLMLLTTLCIKYYFYFPVEETEAQSDESLIVQSYSLSGEAVFLPGNLFPQPSRLIVIFNILCERDTFSFCY